MTLFSLIFALVIIGLVMYLINRFIPMADPYKTLLNVVVVVVVCLWLLGASGILDIPIGRIRR